MRIHHLALRTLDVDRLKAFYRDVVGLVERPAAPGRAWLAAGDVVVMIEPREANEPALAPGSLELVAFAVSTEERACLEEDLPRRGVAVEARTAHTLYVRDPDGRRVAFSSYAF